LNKQYHTNFLITDNAFQSAGLTANQDIDLKGLIKNDLTIKCFRVDKARPKGKKKLKNFLLF